jgi:hypothetical protein
VDRLLVMTAMRRAALSGAFRLVRLARCSVRYSRTGGDNSRKWLTSAIGCSKRRAALDRVAADRWMLSRSRSREEGSGRGVQGGAAGGVVSGVWSSRLLSSSTPARPSAIA